MTIHPTIHPFSRHTKQHSGPKLFLCILLGAVVNISAKYTKLFPIRSFSYWKGPSKEILYKTSFPLEAEGAFTSFFRTLLVLLYYRTSK